MLANNQLVSDSRNADQWMVGYLRTTTFIPDLSMDDIIKNSWCNQIVGRNPEDEYIDYQRSLKAQKSSFHDNLLTIVSQPKRIDWTLEATTDESSEMSTLPTLGSMSNRTLEPFVEIIKQWLDKCPMANRLAFGALLVRPTANIQTGCEEIQQYLPHVQLKPHDTSDFFYQVNRPRKSTVDQSIMINRLNKWSVGLIGTVGVTMDSSTLKTSTNIHSQHVCRLELDINTVVLNSTISRDKTYEIFQELVKHGLEISSEGDVS